VECTGQRQLVDRLVGEGITVVSGEASRPSQFLSCYRKLKDWLQEGQADVCQTFLHHANVMGAFAARDAASCLCVGGIRVAERRWFRSIIESRAIRGMDHVICVSQAVSSFAQANLGAEASRCSVIGNSVDVSRFSTARAFSWSDIGWPRDSCVTLFVGRLHPQKGLELVQQEIDKIAPLNSDRRVLLVGDGPLRSSIERWAHGLGGDRVRLMPWQKDVAPLMKAARLLVLPSHYEGMPNVVLEAFAAGLPVVCSRVEGSQELVSHNSQAQSFEPGDAVTMAALIERLASDQQFSRDVGEANLARARRDFSIPAMVDAYLARYRDLMTRRVDVL
jgi:glycosyltransferase involved in cell wall biosynthesis